MSVKYHQPIYKYLLSAICLLMLTTISFAQDVQWGFKLLEYSSQKGNKAFAAKQALGKPNIFPASGTKPSAWEPRSGKEAFIKIGFIKPIKLKQIVIAETYNPGFISKIFVYDADGREYEVASFIPKAINKPSRLYQLRLSTPYYVIAVKIVLNPEKDKPIAIDAIGISESVEPFEFKIKKSDILKSSIVLTKLSTAVNSKYIELGPLPAPDGNTLYFSRKFDPQNAGGVKDKEDIWYSKLNASTKKWEEAQNVGIPLNNKGANYINSISPDGNTILLGNTYKIDGAAGDGVSISYRTSEGWSLPKKLVIEDEKNKSQYANFFLSNSQKLLLMALERKGEGFGDMDMYVSFLKKDSSWTKPLNLGAIVNTLGEESAPFLASDDRTLYFASTGFSGYGGIDIYVTRRLDDSWTKWSEPENLGPVVNTAFDESYFTMAASGDAAYFVSKGDSTGDRDIYSLALPAALKPAPVVLVRGRVINTQTSLPIPEVKIFFENLESGVEAGIAKSSPGTGEYQILLPSKYRYGYLAEKQGFLSVNENIDLLGLETYTELSNDLYLTPIEVGQTVAINNIFFETDKAELKAGSFLEINRLAALLSASKTLKLEVAGHTDNKGSVAHNEILSMQRAQAVLNALLGKNEVANTQLVLKYYGELKPIATNLTDAGRKQNRRVEIKVLDK